MTHDLKDNFKDRTSERRIMKCGEECEIVEYNSVNDITIKFIKTGEIVKGCQYVSFKTGNVKSHFTPTVFGVGITGLENTVGVNGKLIKSYEVWKSMLRRCYSKRYQQKHNTYIGCKVCEEWLYYKNFKKWYDENYYNIGEQRIELDKDILKKGNKIYSPQTCVLVPHNINSLFIKKDVNRGHLPIGVCWNKQSEKYQAYCKIFDIKNNKYKLKHLGLYSTPKEAFQSYKKAKEKNIKQVADYYKDHIPSRLYDAMYKYEVEITD